MQEAGDLAGLGLFLHCSRMTRDPTIPRLMPAAVERALIEKLGWHYRPNPVDLYAAVYEVLEAMQARIDGTHGS